MATHVLSKWKGHLAAFPRPSFLEWVCLAGGAYLTLRYAWLVDDAYVYFRYIDNFLFLDYGLVYNHGEYVEGFSSPVWTVFLGVLRATQLNYWVIVRAVGVLSFVLFWAILVVLNRGMAPKESGLIVNFPLVCLSFNYGVLCYFTSGLESPFVLLSAALYALFVLHPGSRTLQLLLAVTPLVRHEFAIPLMVAFAWFWYRERRIPLAMIGVTVVVCGAWVLFRIYYYADLFPNTFYLKDVVQIRQGLLYIRDTVVVYKSLYLFAICLGVLLYVLAKTRSAEETRIAERVCMLVIAAPVALYVIKIGGDPKHFRYLAFPFCLSYCAAAGLFEYAIQKTSFQKKPALVFMIGILLAAVTLSFYSRQLHNHPYFLIRERYNPVDDIADASVHRHWEIVSYPWLSWGPDFNLAAYREIRARGEAPYSTSAVYSEVLCAVMFGTPDRRVVHNLGLCDPYLARTDMQIDRPAHRFGLQPMAAQMAHMQVVFDEAPRRGMYRELVERDQAPDWVKNNLDTIEIIEKKMHNRHNFLENLELAFTFPPKIKP